MQAKTKTMKMIISSLFIMLVMALCFAFSTFALQSALAEESGAVHVSGGGIADGVEEEYDPSVGKGFDSLGEAFQWIESNGKECGNATKTYFTVRLNSGLTEDVDVTFTKRIGLYLEFNGNTLEGSLSIKTSYASPGDKYFLYGGTKDMPAAEGRVTGALTVASSETLNTSSPQAKPSIAAELNGLAVNGATTFGFRTYGKIVSGAYSDVVWGATAGGCQIEGGSFSGNVSIENDGSSTVYTQNGTSYRGANYALITGGTFNGDVSFCDWDRADVEVDRMIEGGTFNGKVSNADSSLKLRASDTVLAAFKISEDSNSTDILTEWLQSGTTLSAQDENGYVTLVGETYFAIGDKEYMSMTQIDMAIAEGLEQSNPTVKLLKEYNKTMTVRNSMTLDLNGFNVKATSGKTITLSGPSNSKPISVTILNGTIENAYASTPSSATNGVALYAQSHVSALKMEKVTVKAVGGVAAYIDNCWDFLADECIVTSESKLGTVIVTGSAVQGKENPHKATFTDCEIENTVSTGATSVFNIGAVLSKDDAVELTLQDTDVITVEMPGLYVSTPSVVKVSGGVIDAGYTSKINNLYGVGVYGDFGADITLDGVKVEGGTPMQIGSVDKDNADTAKANFADVTVNNSTLRGIFDGIKMYGNESLSGVTITIEDSIVECDIALTAILLDPVAAIHGYEGNSNTSVTVKGNSVIQGNGNDAILNYGDLMVEGGAVEGEVADKSAADKTVALVSGTFNGNIRSENQTAFIQGGAYAEAFESKYLAAGSALVSTDGKYGVVDENSAEYIAQVTSKDGAYSVRYETLREAIDAAQSGDTVTLLDNITESVIVADGKELILDFDGYVLTNKAGQHTLVNNGTLTINGGTFDNVSHGNAALVNKGTVVLNGGVFTRSKEAGTEASDNGNSWYVIYNEGQMIVNAGVEIHNKNAETGMYGGYSSLIINNADCKADNTTLTVNGGMFMGGRNTVKNDEAGILVVKDGMFGNTTQAVILNWSEAEISGGTFNTSGTATQAVATGKWNDSTSSTVINTEITGGVFNGDIIITSGDAGYWDEKLQYNEISGGTFSEKPDESFFAEGYSVYLNSEGDYVALENEIAETVINALQAYADELKVKYGALYNKESLDKIAALVEEGKAKLIDAIANGAETADILNAYRSKLDAVAEEQFAEDIAALQNKIDALNALTAENHAAVTEQITALGAQISDLKTALDALAETENAHYAAMAEKLAVLQTKLADLDKLNAAIVELTGKVENLDGLLEALDGKVNTVDDLIEALTAMVEEQFDAVTNEFAEQQKLSEQQFAELNGKIDGLNTALAALKGVTDKLAMDENAHYTALTEKITALESKLAALDTLSDTIEALGGRVDDMEALMNGLDGKIGDLTDLINDLKEQLEAAEKKTEGQATAVTAVSAVGGVIVVGLAALVIVTLIKRRKKAE